MNQDEKDQIVLGTVKFSLIKLRKLFTRSEIKQLYEEFQWHQRNGIQIRLERLLPMQALQSVIEYKAQKLNVKLYDQQDPYSFSIRNSLNSFNIFSHIQFTNLTILNIAEENFISLQALGFVNAPKLRCLQFYYNHITNLNTLVKADFPRLEVITFYHNPINQMERFCRFHSKKLTGYEFDNEKSYKNRLQDYRFLFKMENPVPKMLKVQDENRIDISKKASYKILDQPGTRIINRTNATPLNPYRIRVRERGLGYLD